MKIFWSYKYIFLIFASILINQGCFRLGKHSKDVVDIGILRLDNGQEFRAVYISKNESIDTFMLHSRKDSIFKYPDSILFQYKKSPFDLKSGRYILSKGVNSKQVIDILKLGNDSPVTFQISMIRFEDQLASKASRLLNCDSLEITKIIDSDSFQKSLGLDSNSKMNFLFANTLKLNWATNSKELLNLLVKDFKFVWNEERRKSLEKNTHLTVSQAMVLASIVQDETSKIEEAPFIASVYLNRLQKKMRLEADPTLRYLKLKKSRTEKIQRVFIDSTLKDSPFNTYRKKGLPPMEIITPEIWAIDAVVYPQNHKYLYFVALDDFSGFHHFSATFEEHVKYANKYRAALNKKGILK